jgi:hypothetical protein
MVGTCQRRLAIILRQAALRMRYAEDFFVLFDNCSDHARKFPYPADHMFIVSEKTLEDVCRQKNAGGL